MKKLQLNFKFLPLLITITLFLVLFFVGSITYTGFFSLQVFLNLFIDNAFLIITAIGMTIVLIIGGIDISVGSVIALTCMACADLLEKRHMNPFLVIFLMLLMGTIFGLIQGCLITFFKMQPFIVTLAGLFLARGMTAVISTESISITNPVFTAISFQRVYLPGTKAFISIGVIIALVMLIVTMFIAHYTKFGRTAYAIGGNEQSALLMGLPVIRTKVLIYTFNGFCSALAGIVFAFYMLSGFTLHAVGLEMDAIASAVIGGTLLTGGVGYVIGTIFGVLTQGTIQTIIMFQGTLSSWWTKIAIAFLLCAFIIIQSVLNSRREIKKAANRGIVTKKTKQIKGVS